MSGFGDNPYATNSAASRHGTVSRYSSGKCRCAECKQASAEYKKRLAAGTYATRAELEQFMVSLGWDKRIPRQLPQVFVQRWNREHPDRPYVTT